jgi:5-methylcytosine-specific restriction endonuclease McrA
MKILTYNEFKAVLKFVLGKKCTICGASPHSPHIHHIDGVHTNNALNNVVLVCEPCHRLVHKNVNRHIKLPETDVLRLQKIFEDWVILPDVQRKKKAKK